MQARRLTVAQRQQLRRARLQYSMWHELDQGGVSDMEEGWQSWRVKATEADAEEPFAQLRLYRIPLNNGGDPILTADYDNWIPHTAVYSVLDGDHLVPAVAARLARPDLTKDPGASMLLLEPAWIDDAVDGAGLAELLWTLVLADLRGLSNSCGWLRKKLARYEPPPPKKPTAGVSRPLPRSPHWPRGRPRPWLRTGRRRSVRFEFSLTTRSTGVGC